MKTDPRLQDQTDRFCEEFRKTIPILLLIRLAGLAGIGQGGILRRVLRRYAFLIMFAWWMGGLTFYALVVIPTAEQVLGNHHDVGFITQKVTYWLNLSGLLPIAVLFWNLKVEWATASKWPRRLLLFTWAVIVFCQFGLFTAHGWLGQVLDRQHHRIIDYDTFQIRHNIYEAIVTVQWLAALVHTWFAVRTWKQSDLGSVYSPTCDRLGNPVAK
jgi:hypothetical protein